MNEIPRFFKVKEVAEILRISTQQAYNLIKAGKLIAHRVGDRRLVVKLDDLLAYIEQARASEPSQPVFMLEDMLKD